MEVQLHEQRSGDKPEEPNKIVHISEFDDSAFRYAATLSEPEQAEWQRILMRFQEDLAKVEHLRQPLTYSYEQEELAQRGELNVGHMKLRYLPTQHLRMVEIMCVTDFIYSGFVCFIIEFRDGRKKAYDKWLQDQ